jgi:ribosomal protein L40E
MNYLFKTLAILLLSLGNAWVGYAEAPPDGHCGNAYSRPSAPPAKAGLRLLKAGDQLLDSWTCKRCQTNQPATADSAGNQACATCGNSHSDEPYIPQKTVTIGNELYVEDPGVLIASDSPMAEYAASGPVWVCGFCTSTNSGTAESCGKCGAIRMLTPTYAGPSEQPQGDPLSLQASPSNASTNIAEEAPVADYPHQTSPSLLQQQRAIERGSSSIPQLKRAALVAVVSVALIGGSVYSYFRAMATYETDGTLSLDRNGNYAVSYREGDKEKTVVLDPQDLIGIPVRREGEPVRLHFRNISGLRGVERSNGDSFVPRN